YGSEGYYVEGKGFFNPKHEPIPVEVEAPPSAGAMANFLNAVRSRKPEDIQGTALDGHLSSAHCHLANVSYRLGEELRFDPKRERFLDSKKANRMLSRDYRKEFEVPKLA
ncbi:MAG: gfo/Idh/MocA family oxidoreductase, partial [Candidatus Hydrogenedentes bacterium]|nr:gfo/Idh/MocA family oxidoreductase [Candidatus Hydrogenedentota bacterium]